MFVNCVQASSFSLLFRNSGIPNNMVCCRQLVDRLEGSVLLLLQFPSAIAWSARLIQQRVEPRPEHNVRTYTLESQEGNTSLLGYTKCVLAPFASAIRCISAAPTLSCTLSFIPLTWLLHGFASWAQLLRRLPPQRLEPLPLVWLPCGRASWARLLLLQRLEPLPLV